MKWELVSHSPSSISCTSSFPTPLYLFPSSHLPLPLSLPHLAPFWIILSSCFLNPPSCSVCLPSSPLVSPLILPHVIRKLKRSFSPCPRVSLSLSLSLAFTFHFHPSLSQIVSRLLALHKKKNSWDFCVQPSLLTLSRVLTCWLPIMATNSEGKADINTLLSDTYLSQSGSRKTLVVKVRFNSAWKKKPIFTVEKRTFSNVSHFSKAAFHL